MKPVLEVHELTQDFGGLRALNEVCLKVDEKEIVALIGPNGAGKTTFFNCVTGIYRPTAGSINLTVDGVTHSLIGKKTHEITALGMARTFQNIRLFSQMTVLENVMVGCHCRTRAGILSALLRDRRTREEEQQTVDKSYDLLKTVGLERQWDETACNLPYGDQRRLEIARALATDPHMLLLDEPAAGMNPNETRDLRELILSLRERYSLSVLLIEHDMSMVMSLSELVMAKHQSKPMAN